MAARGGDRRPGPDRRDDEYPPRKTQFGPGKEPIREAVRAPPRLLNEYFIDGDGISREVLQIDICKHLGPEATSRPANYNGKNGFVIKALRPFTPAQLEDLKAASELYDYDRRRARDERREEPSYYDTAARRDQGRFNSEPSNSGDYYPPGPGGYPPSTNSMYTNNPGYAPSAYTTAPNYPTSYTMVSGSTIPATYGPVSGAYDPNYTTYAPQPPTGYPADYQQYAGGNYDQYAQPRNPTGRTTYDPQGRPLAPYDDRNPHYGNEQAYQNAPNAYAGGNYPTRPGVPQYEAPGRDTYAPRAPQPDPNAGAYRRGGR